ncbi:MAG: galactitol-1-phosphate 5-dehydrogenase [Caldilineaceae bacterium]|nr:galactitol-1-phosphate 5-dehydrogenase [Caldilineaceae bacterium]
MQALVYENPWQMPLRDVQEPEPGDHEVTVEVVAVGICGSDVHGYTGSTGRRTPPLIMGHEFSGVIDRVGRGVTGYQRGDCVTVQPLITCGECENCRVGRYNLCSRRSGIGMNVDGAYAERVRVPAAQLYRMPETLSFTKGAMVEPLAVAMRAANLTPLHLAGSVAVIGAGTIGLLTITALRMKGAGRIVAIDVDEHKLEMAERVGADALVNSRKTDPVEAVRALGGVDAVVEAVGITATAALSVQLPRNGGHVTWIGNSAPEVTINMQQVVTRELTVSGTYGFTHEFGDALEAIARGRIDPTVLVEQTAPLSKGPELFHALATGNANMVKVMLDPTL